MSEQKRFNDQMSEQAHRAAAMKAICIDSQFDANGVYITDDEKRLDAIDEAAHSHAMFESLDDSQRRTIISAAQASVKEYEQTYGCLPRDEVFASAHKTFENMVSGSGKAGGDAAMMLESIGQSMTTSEGVEIRAKMLGLILPTALATQTLDAVTLMPANYDEMELFQIYRTAGTSFGDFARGTIIDDATVGQYSQMRQRYPLPSGQQPDGSKTTYVFTSSTDLTNTSGTQIPMRKNSVVVYLDHKVVARELDSQPGKLFGSINGNSLTGTIDAAKGVITINTTNALADGKILHVQFEVDIEAKPELIPVIEHQMDSRKLRPSQNAIAADATIQSMFAMQREFGIDYKSMQMSHLRNYLAAEKTNRHLIDMKFACVREKEFNIYVPNGEDWKLHRELLREVLLGISQEMLASNKVSGIVGMYAGKYASTVLKSLGQPHFVPAPNYRQLNRVHYAGVLFGMWKVFEAPIILEDDEVLLYGRGEGYAQSGYVAGDAIAATMYTHPIGANLRSRNTLWELSYGEVHPFDGENYFYRLRIKNTDPMSMQKLEAKMKAEKPVSKK